MGGEKLGLIFEGFSNGYVLINLLLRATLDTIVSKIQRIYLSLQEIEGIGTLVHQVYLSNYTNGALTIGVNFTCHL